MSVWHIRPINDRSRVSSLAFIAIVIMVGGLFVTQNPSASRTATVLDAVATPSLSPSEDSVFDQPQSIVWDGYIRRVLAGGEGLEVVGPSAPGGVFHAYMASGQTSPIDSGPILIRGAWTGYTCAYSSSCVPEVRIESIEAQSIELE